MDNTSVIVHTRRWIQSIVIDLDLCPFAQRVFEGEKIRYVVSDALTEDALVKNLETELQHLAAEGFPGIETTLLIHPHVLTDFLEYNDFLDSAEELISQLDLTGVIQIASFHPDYQFADTQPDDVENYTNRSPYPMLHLLREDSVSMVATDPRMLADIPRRNIELMKSVGRDKILARLREIADPPATNR